MARNWTESQGETATQTETRDKLERPRLWRVLLHNDNYTTMDFVVQVLIAVFHKPEAEAVRIMYDVHRKGTGIVGLYTHEVAESKVRRVLELAQQAEFPLLCTMEPE